MAFHIIPVDRLSSEALGGLIEEFISRSATDYGASEASPDAKFKQVRQALKKGLAVLVYDDTLESANILRKDDPALKKLNGPDG